MGDHQHGIWHTVREYATHWTVAGALLAATGTAPEHWVAEIIHHIPLPEGAVPSWAAVIDYRLVAVIAGLSIIVGDTVWRNHRRREHVSAGAPEPAALPTVPATPERLPLPDKPSIAVLAFTNMSDDPGQEYFSDGIAEDITTTLSQVSWLFVIARNSSFTYKGRAVDLKQVGRELGVRYILEGSVRRSDNLLRITGQLIEAETGAHVWAERYDRTLNDMFAIQDEITRAVVSAIEPVLAASERDRAGRMAPDRLGTWELYHRGMWHFFRLTLEDYHAAGKFLAEAEKLDPTSPAVQTGLALCTLTGGWLFAPAERTAWLRTGREYARIATSLNPRDSMAHSLYGLALVNWGEHEAALKETTLSVDLNPNNSWAQGMHGGVLAYSGRPGDSLPHFELAFRLSPVDPLRWLWSHMSATALFFHGDYEASLAAGKDLIHALPNAVFGYRACMAALVKLGRAAEAGDYADIIHTRFSRELAGFLTTRWGEWRESEHAAYAATIAAGGLVLRDNGVLERVRPS